jgi:hypothetical protein
MWEKRVANMVRQTTTKNSNTSLDMQTTKKNSKATNKKNKGAIKRGRELAKGKQIGIEIGGMGRPGIDDPWAIGEFII